MATRVDQIKQAGSTKLRNRETHVLVRGRQPGRNRKQTTEHLQAQKRQFCEVLNRLRVEIRETKVVPAKANAKIEMQIERLYAELGSAEDETEQACARIKGAITSFEATVYQELNEISDALARELTNEANSLSAELEALYARSENVP